jgi:hypothetical protein
MPLQRIAIPQDLVTAGPNANFVLNRRAHPELNGVTGEPEGGVRDAALREAFAALQIVREQDPRTADPFVFLGEAAVHYVYGRAKRSQEMDCDVVGSTYRYQRNGYLLGEGKGTEVIHAKEQFDAVAALLRARDIGAGPVLGALIVSSSLRYLEWDVRQRTWIAYHGDKPQPNVTARLQQNIAGARYPLDRKRVYLIDGPADENNNLLPKWFLNAPVSQPFPVWVQQNAYAYFPLRVGEGQIRIYYVQS